MLNTSDDLYEIAGKSPSRDEDDLYAIAGKNPSQDYEHKTKLPDRISEYFVPPIRGGAIKGIGNLFKTAGNVGPYLSPLLGAMAPQAKELGQDIQDMAPDVENPDLFQKILSGVAEYAPTLPLYEAAPVARIGKAGSIISKLLSPSIQKAAIGGGAGGAINMPENPLLGAALGTGLGAVTQGGANLVGATAKGIGGQLSKYVKPQLTEKIRDFFGTPHADNESAFGMASDRYHQAMNSENNAWENLKSNAENIDAGRFDESLYKNEIKNKLNSYKKEIEKNPALAGTYREPIKYLSDFLNSDVDSFGAAIKHNTVLNHLLRQEINPNTTTIKTDEEVRALNWAKNKLQKAIKGNIENEGLQDSLGKEWQEANQLTAERASTFEQVPTAKGGVNKNTFSRIKNNPFAEGNVGNFITDYLPQKGRENTAKFNQLGKMIGDPSEATNIIKKNYFKDSLNEHNVDPNKFITLYKGLSEKDQNYLFDGGQRKQIKALEVLVKNHKGPLHHAFWYHSLPAILGGLIGHHFGGSFVEGGALGYGGTQAIEKMLPSAFKNQNLYDKAINSLLRKPQEMNASQNVSPLTKILNTQMQGDNSNGY